MSTFEYLKYSTLTSSIPQSRAGGDVLKRKRCLRAQTNNIHVLKKSPRDEKKNTGLLQNVNAKVPSETTTHFSRRRHLQGAVAAAN
jgi:hypothetical protein